MSSIELKPCFMNSVLIFVPDAACLGDGLSHAELAIADVYLSHAELSRSLITTALGK